MKRGIKIFLVILIIAIFFALYLIKNSSITIRIFGVVFGLTVFYLVDSLFKIGFKRLHYLIILIILVFGILLSPLYFLSESYDKILHLTLSFLSGFIFLYIINKQKLSMKWKLLIVFGFILSAIAIHEMGEYIIDGLWDFKLQGVFLRDVAGLEKYNVILPPNDDTLIDMLLGTIGAFTFSISRYIYYKIKKR